MILHAIFKPQSCYGGNGKESTPVVTECAAVGKAANDLTLVTTADEP